MASTKDDIATGVLQALDKTESILTNELFPEAKTLDIKAADRKSVV